LGELTDLLQLFGQVTQLFCRFVLIAQRCCRSGCSRRLFRIRLFSAFALTVLFSIAFT
jgi:hypothetical protein